MSDTPIHVQLKQKQDYQFDIHFGGDVPMVMGDEPAPLGAGQGPSPVQLLAASVGNCLSDSLLFALRKFKQAPEPLTCDVHAQVGRNAEGFEAVVDLVDCVFDEASAIGVFDAQH